MISERELELNGWRLASTGDGKTRYEMRFASSPFYLPRINSRLRTVRGIVTQRPNRGWWDAYGTVVNENTGAIVDRIHRVHRTAREAMARLQGEPWRRA